MKTYVFVYGTLQRNEPNHHFLTSSTNGFSKYVGRGRLVDKYPLILATDMNVPFLLDKKGTGKNILGEVFEVDDQMLGELDKLEKAPEIYERVKAKVTLYELGEGQDILCELYVLPKFRDSLLELPFIGQYSESEAGKYHYRPGTSNEEAIKIAKQFLW